MTDFAAARAVLAKDPDNRDAQRALAVRLYKLGDVKLKAGDVSGALHVVSREPRYRARNSTVLARSALRWVSTEKLGDAKLAIGDTAGAVAAFERGLALAKTRAGEEPNNPEAARDLSISLTKVAALARTRQDYKGALEITTRRSASGAISPPSMKATSSRGAISRSR